MVRTASPEDLRAGVRIGRDILEEGSEIGDLGQGYGKLATDLYPVFLGMDEDDGDTAVVQLLRYFYKL